MGSEKKQQSSSTSLPGTIGAKIKSVAGMFRSAIQKDKPQPRPQKSTPPTRSRPSRHVTSSDDTIHKGGVRSSSSSPRIHKKPSSKFTPKKTPSPRTPTKKPSTSKPPSKPPTRRTVKRSTGSREPVPQTDPTPASTDRSMISNPTTPTATKTRSGKTKSRTVPTPPSRAAPPPPPTPPAPSRQGRTNSESGQMPNSSSSKSEKHNNTKSEYVTNVDDPVGRDAPYINRSVYTDIAISPGGMIESSAEDPHTPMGRRVAVESSNSSIRNVKKNVHAQQKPSLIGSPPTSEITTGPTEEKRKIVLLISSKSLLELEQDWIEVAKPQRFVDRTLCSHFAANMHKNRYNDIPCFDSSRVILRNWSTDYIHANYIRTAMAEKRFICTQGPTKNSHEDFWYMIMQENVKLIVQLCDFIEQNRNKCYKYFPEGTNMRIIGKHIVVACTSKTTFHEPDVYLREFKLTRLMNGQHQEWVVQHLMWSSWPDHGVPREFDTVRAILKKMSTVPGPIVVHCSAGIGRTGSIVALQMALDKVEAGVSFDGFKSIVQELRSQRIGAVQTPSQYLWINRVLIEMWADSATRNVPQVRRFIDDYEQQTTPPPPSAEKTHESTETK